MKDKVLDEIKTSAINKLKDSYLYCAAVESDDFAMLNTDDGQGNNIRITIEKITIKSKPA